MIDLRSDTVTQPTDAMRDAIANATVGDDVYQDDPTVNALLGHVCELTGMAAAAFFPSGTQSNLAGIMAHCQRGDEYIVGQDAHTYRFEGGGAAVLGSIQPQPLPHAADGTLPLEAIEAVIKPYDIHFPQTRLLALENTWGGRVIDQHWIEQACELAHAKGLMTHLDGARLFNASVATGQAVKTLCAPFDSVSLCLSKGLGSPQGSVLAGSQEVIDAAIRWRKMLGGGMRQSGMMAAAGLHALEHHVERLAEDHHNAQQLAEGVADIKELRNVGAATNMVFFELDASRRAGLQAHLEEQGIQAFVGPRTRLVTHIGISPEDIETVVAAFRRYFAE